MRVCFLVPELSRSGGVGVVLRHARHLREEHGFEVDLVGPGEPGGGGRYDVAVATWWATADRLYRLDAARRAVLVQSLEQQWYRADEEADRLAAALPLSLPVSFIAVSQALRDAVARLRPDAPCHLVRNGIDKDLFRPRPPRDRAGGPLRVLVEGQPTIWLKGVADAVRAVRRMREPAHLTVVSLRPDGTEDLGADVVRTGLAPSEMADAYADADVVLKLSRVEGLGLPALEAMHMGVPCVVTPYTGHSDYLVHGRNGVVVEFDDEPGTAGWLDLLARDRALLERLGGEAARTAEAWPDPAGSAALLAGALRAIADAEPPPVDDALAGIVERVRLAGELARNREGALRWHAGALAEARAGMDEYARAYHECERMLDEARRRDAALNSSLLYRVLRRARRTARVDPLWP